MLWHYLCVFLPKARDSAYNKPAIQDGSPVFGPICSGPAGRGCTSSRHLRGPRNDTLHSGPSPCGSWTAYWCQDGVTVTSRLRSARRMFTAWQNEDLHSEDNRVRDYRSKDTLHKQPDLYSWSSDKCATQSLPSYPWSLSAFIMLRNVDAPMQRTQHLPASLNLQKIFFYGSSKIKYQTLSRAESLEMSGAVSYPHRHKTCKSITFPSAWNL